MTVGEEASEGGEDDFEKKRREWIFGGGGRQIVAYEKYKKSLRIPNRTGCYTDLSAMPLHSRAHSCLIDSSPKISATKRAPCKGGLEYIGRTSIFN